MMLYVFIIILGVDETGYIYNYYRYGRQNADYNKEYPVTENSLHGNLMCSSFLRKCYISIQQKTFIKTEVKKVLFAWVFIFIA